MCQAQDRNQVFCQMCNKNEIIFADMKQWGTTLLETRRSVVNFKSPLLVRMKENIRSKTESKRKYDLLSDASISH